MPEYREFRCVTKVGLAQANKSLELVRGGVEEVLGGSLRARVQSKCRVIVEQNQWPEKGNACSVEINATKGY
jgi:hypothetical protein